MALRDPLTDRPWSDQDARWWAHAGASARLEQTDHQLEALHRGLIAMHLEREPRSIKVLKDMYRS